MPSCASCPASSPPSPGTERKLLRRWANDSPQSNEGRRRELRGLPVPGREANMPGKLLRFLLASSAAATLSAPAAAQDDLESLAAATQQVESGMTLARGQIAASDLTGALGALERILLVHPEAV